MRVHGNYLVSSLAEVMKYIQWTRTLNTTSHRTWSHSRWWVQLIWLGCKGRLMVIVYAGEFFKQYLFFICFWFSVIISLVVIFCQLWKSKNCSESLLDLFLVSTTFYQSMRSLWNNSHVSWLLCLGNPSWLILSSLYRNHPTCSASWNILITSERRTHCHVQNTHVLTWIITS